MTSSAGWAANINHFGAGRAGPGLFSLDADDVLPAGGWGARSTYTLMNEPLVCVGPHGDREVAIKNAHVAALAMAWSPVDSVELSLGLPRMLADVRFDERNRVCGEEGGLSGYRAGINDPELRARWRAGRIGPLSASVRAGVRAPVASVLRVDPRDGEIFGDPYGSALLGVTAGLRLRRVLLVADVGINARPDLTAIRVGLVESELTFGAGVEGTLPLGLAVAAELNGRFSEVSLAGGQRESQLPLELVAGLKYRVDAVEVTLAGGGGLSPGYGTPRARILMSVAFHGDGMLPVEWLRGARAWLPDLRDAVGRARATRVKPDERFPVVERPVDEEPECPDPLSPEAALIVVPGCPEPAGAADEAAAEDDVDDLLVDELGECPTCAGGDPSLRELIVVVHLTFAHDVAALAPGEQQRLVRELRAPPAGATLTFVDVIAHADATGADAYNDQLSSRRARNVIEALVAAGIPQEIVSSAARGARDPLLDDQVHEANRRVRVALHYTLPQEAE